MSYKPIPIMGKEGGKEDPVARMGPPTPQLPGGGVTDSRSRRTVHDAGVSYEIIKLCINMTMNPTRLERVRLVLVD